MFCYIGRFHIVYLKKIKKSKGKISEVPLISMNDIYTVLMAL